MIYRGLKLDDFQIEAIDYVESNHSVLVTAPTGVGKTIIADYLVEKHVRNNDLVIYTSPIKALSNQKFRDYCRFLGPENVGLLTGDFKINPYANLLIMTTEILRNMLYGESEDLKGLKYVIFDEFHFLANEERGVAWEECLIHLPEDVKVIGLSATAPNTREVADWLSIIRKEDVKVVRHTERIVPLDFRIFNFRHKIKSIHDFGKLYEKYKASKKTIEKRQIGKKNETSHIDVISYIREEYLPALYFVFSRKKTEMFASKYVSARSFVSTDEQQEIEDYLNAKIKEYSIENFPNYRHFYRIIIKGVGFHHAGMTPLYKRIVEELFERRLLKLIFCTSTFAMGINFPAKSVVFDDIYKFNGKEFAFLTCQQFHQKAGRAGRRGIDDKGHIFIRSDFKTFDSKKISEYMKNKTEDIKSSFVLSYNSIVNLLDNRPLKHVYEIINMSLWAYQNNSQLPKWEKRIDQQKAFIDKSKAFECDYSDELFNTRVKEGEYRIKKLENNIRSLEGQIKRLRLLLEKKKLTFAKVDEYERNISKSYDRIKGYKETIKQLEEDSTKYLCQDCENYAACKKHKANLQQSEKKIVFYQDKIEHIKNYLVNNFTARCNVMMDLGFLDEDFGLNSSGKILKEITIMDLAVSELIMQNTFERLDEKEIVAILISLTSRSERNSPFKLVCRSITKDLKGIEKYIRLIERLEDKYEAPGSELVFNKFISGYGYLWADGMSWQDLIGGLETKSIDYSGDLIYSFRRTIDLLRQLKNVYKNDERMLMKLNETIKLIDRDIVEIEL